MSVSATTLSKPSPFDALASTYDRLFTDSLIGRAQRQAVWRKLRTVFKPGSRILEINCGTGADAVFLAKLGVRVLATDSSANMIAVSQQRIEQNSLQEWVSTRQLAIEELAQIRSEAPFDGLLSNFGGLNCIRNLETRAKDLAGLLKPASPAILCLMGPWCAWEIVYYLSRLQPAKALRRMRKDGACVRLRDCQGSFGDTPTISRSERLSENEPVQVYYPTIAQLKSAFAPHFRLRSSQAIGLIIPPSYLEPWIAQHPRFLSLAAAFDAYVSHWPGLRNFGDHNLVEMERV
jgi:SAM-dependent methyltransferase